MEFDLEVTLVDNPIERENAAWADRLRGITPICFQQRRVAKASIRLPVYDTLHSLVTLFQQSGRPWDPRQIPRNEKVLCLLSTQYLLLFCVNAICGSFCA